LGIISRSLQNALTMEIEIIREIETLQDEARELLEAAVSTLLTPTTDSIKQTQIKNSFEAIRKLTIASQKLGVLKAKIFYKPVHLPNFIKPWQDGNDEVTGLSRE
jgi:hypothetical protein